MAAKNRSNEIGITWVYNAPSSKGRLGGMDRSKTSGAVAGAARLYTHHPQQRSKAGGTLVLYHAWPRWIRLP